LSHQKSPASPLHQTSQIRSPEPKNVRKSDKFQRKLRNSSKLNFLTFLAFPAAYFPFPKTKIQSAWKHPIDLIQKKKVHQNRNSPSKLVEFAKSQNFPLCPSWLENALNLLSFQLPFSSLLPAISRLSQTNLIAESRSNATRQNFNQEIFHEFFFVEISVISAMILNVGLFFRLELGWPRIDCVLADGLQKLKIDWVFGNWFCPEGLK
jgi:hypothetical protein